MKENHIFDTIHGTVDIRDETNSSQIIKTLLQSDILQRLAHISQLGFATENWSTAVHKRYMHAVGSLHTMRSIWKRLRDTPHQYEQVFNSLALCFPDCFTGNVQEDDTTLAQHMLVAALTQDIGELPYSRATKYIFEPDEQIVNTVENFIGHGVAHWPNKNIFTVACIIENADLFDTLQLPLIIYLITGEKSVVSKCHDDISLLRHMLDGVVDADRLDYVYRDQYYMNGINGSPELIISSILYFDQDGPVFNDPMPVSNFLITRAGLYSSVYLAPRNRFRVIVLLTLLKEIMLRQECASEFFPEAPNGKIPLEVFLSLDDVSLLSRIKRFDRGTSKRLLPKRARVALDIFVHRESSYRALWLPNPDEKTSSLLHKQKQETTLPEDLFFDTIFEQSRSFYFNDSVRVRNSEFALLGDTISLEQCGGLFSIISDAKSTEGGFLVATPGDVLLFTPPDERQIGAAWQQIRQALNEGWLYDTLVVRDPGSAISFPNDTRYIREFSGPAIFISYTGADQTLVKRIAYALYRRQRRYYVYFGNKGIGRSPADNSFEAVEQADIVVICASQAYLDKYKNEPNGYVAIEVNAMVDRVQGDGLGVFVLSSDDFTLLKNKIAWSRLGITDTPFVKPLRNASNLVFEEVIDEMLKYLSVKCSVKQNVGAGKLNKSFPVLNFFAPAHPQAATFVEPA